MEFGLRATPSALAKLEQYYEYLIKENQVMNLTAITDREAVYARHFLDSLAILKTGPLAGATLLDVGAGAGFPSLPLKIFVPELKVTIIEATKKKIEFLKRLLGILDIADVELLALRAEAYAGRERFDIVTARAVAALNELAELCLPFTKVGGRFIAMKATGYEAELETAMTAISKLGGRFESVIPYQIAPDRTHVLIVIRKQKPTPTIYPRAFGKIKKNPL